MTIVQVNKYLMFVLLCLTVASCKTTNNKESKKNSPVVVNSIAEVYDYSNIETNRKNDGFDWELIDTLPVKVGDTVLFFKDAYLEDNKVTIANKTSDFEIKATNNLDYYKTGTNKFSTYEINFKNTKDKKSFNFYIYSNHGKQENPYNLNNMSSYVDIVKVNDTLAKFDILANYFDEYDLYFTIKNNTINIIKIFIHSHFYSEQFFHELDTLINITENNKFIDIQKLQSATEDKRNLKKTRMQDY